MDSDSESQDVESASNELQRYKVEKRVAESVDPLKAGGSSMNADVLLCQDCDMHASHLSSMRTII